MSAQTKASERRRIAGKLVIAQTALRGADLLCEGSIRIGWVDAAALKPGRIPAAILESLNR